ncbi:hypothetical protein A2U01_0113564, partial [Trifolium medium]|nr:hypothetical protein [Trifolium medium]
KRTAIHATDTVLS